MSFWHRDSRYQLGVVCGLSLLSLAAVWSMCLRPQLSDMDSLRLNKVVAVQKLQQAQYLIDSLELAKAELNEAQIRLDAAEAGMAMGDLFDWTISAFKDSQSLYD